MLSFDFTIHSFNSQTYKGGWNNISIISNHKLENKGNIRET